MTLHLTMSMQQPQLLLIHKLDSN